MERDFLTTLDQWKQNSLRKPLIVRGARQVGKTFIIENWGKKKFPNFVSINFESSPQYQKCFDIMDPFLIIQQIELLHHSSIIPGQTLLFLDEIQQCPKAIQSLRYFKENLEDLHVIAAGSLLDFAIQDEQFSFPVGRVQFAKLYPCSLGEFLDACGDGNLRKQLLSYTIKQPPPAAIHEYCLGRVREYFLIGGMPASIMAFLNTRSYLEVKYVQKSLLDAFEADFGKYANKTKHRHLRKIFEQVPRLIGSHVKYSRIDPELPNPAREMKLAIELLQRAGLVHLVCATNAHHPLLSGIKEHIFKLLFLDIGLIEQIMNLDPQDPGLMTGPLAEQFVGQELLAMSDPFLDERLFFWSREKVGSSAEVDYIFGYRGGIFPIEVKAGKTGKLKSIQLFIQEKKIPFGIKISQEPLGWKHNILSVPFYMVNQIPRLIEYVLKEAHVK